MKEEFLQVSVNGLRMQVMSAGQGPAVLLLHGFPDTHIVWRKQIAPLVNAGYRVLAPDLRGYGGTDAPGAVSAYRIEYVRDDVLGLMDLLGIERARVVGHDWGALLGWQLCMDAPGRVERYAALSVGHPAAFASAGLMQKLRSSYMLWFMLPGVAEASLRAGDFFALRRFTSEPAQAGYWRQGLREPGRLTAALNYYRANVPHGLKLGSRRDPVPVPVMGIWSSLDPALGEEQMLGSRAFVAASFRYERIDGADHWLQLTAAEQVNRLLLDFFSENTTQAAAPRAAEAG